MTFEILINELDCSVRSHNILLRAHNSAKNGYISAECNDVVKDKIKSEILEVETYTELKDFIEKYGRYLRHFGLKSRDEIISLCSEKIEKGDCQKAKGWKRITDGLPPLGVPLMCKTIDHTNGGRESIKYPIYYAKEPYENRYAWYFFSVDGISKLLIEYSEVVEWREVHE